MAGQKFQYDESGSTFFYFLISCLGIVLVPYTVYFWSSESSNQETLIQQEECNCENCKRKKLRLKKPEKWKAHKKSIQHGLILLGWIVMAILIYKVQEFDYEYANFDPYEILEISTQSSVAEIKKAYRKLSLLYHPDKPTGDEKKFMKLNKAYQALTDDTARKNYELYGNPDGPGPMNFGIALPSWIVEKENSFWVLGLYALVFMIGLPTVVAIWWYRSSKFSNDQVLLDTTQLYYYFFHKTPQMTFRRALMVLAGSLEFEKGHNPEVVERPSDNVEVPWLIKHIPNLGEKNKEPPLSFPYSLKARSLLHSHLSRIPLNENTLDLDRLFIIKLCPTLINEMVSCVSQLIMLAHAGRISRLPSLDTIEATMSLSSHIVQSLWLGKNPLLQLPHITDESLRNLLTKKKQIKSIQQFVSLPADERRNVLQTFTDEQYNDIMRVCASLPHIQMDINYEVVDDDDSCGFTAGAIVTVTVHMYRQSLEETFGERHVDVHNSLEKSLEKHVAKTEKTTTVSGWRPPPSKKAKIKKKANVKVVKDKKDTKQDKNDDKKSSDNVDKHKVKKDKVEDLEDDSNDDESGSHSDESIAEKADTESHRDEKIDEDDDAEWEKFQKGLSKKEKVLEGKSKHSHSVHCPFFTDDKQEYWWVYVCDNKKRMLITAPFQVTDLVTEEEVQLKFTAPMKTGVYIYQVCLRSDSYLGMDQTQDIRLDVKEAKEAPTSHPQWNEFSSEEDNNDGSGGGDDNDSDFTTDDEITDSD